MVLRKHPTVVYPLPDWVRKGIVTAQEHDILMQALGERKTLCFSGAVGSAKTSLLNACPTGRLPGRFSFATARRGPT